MKHILSIDQGTSSTRVIIYDENGIELGIGQKEHSQYYPHEAWVEHNPLEIKENVLYTMKVALQQANLNISDIHSIGITNQRETIVAWEKDSGIPLSNAIVWQCRRTNDIIQQLKNEDLEGVFKVKTGLVLDSYFSGTKIKWLIENNENVNQANKNKTLAVGTIDSWIIKFLSGNHKTDASNASRTLLYDINKAEWSSELSEILGIDPTILPEVHPNATSEPFGTYKGVPIRGVLGDQQAALFGQNGYNSSEIKTTYGTGNFTLMNLGSNVKISDKGLLTTVAWQIDKNLTYAMEGSVFITGAAFQWLRDELQIINSYAEIDDYSNKIENSGGVYFVPAFVGLGAPYWDTSARGTITGLTR
ncbi:MAG: FGGY family carbohydrate kinase, partial [Candidatus Heimdallarchaeota archaeon]|nr:FGGY family carbohydrate kinase [Candidatus Heimdallarchaeota archaeon]